MKLTDEEIQDDAYWSKQDYTTRHIDGSPAGKDGCTPEKRCVACIEDQHLADQEGRELKKPADIAFEILLSSNASEWPESAEGVRPVLKAVQAMLYAAQAGSSRGFDEAEAELDEAIYAWHEALFGLPETSKAHDWRAGELLMKNGVWLGPHKGCQIKGNHRHEQEKP